MAYVNAAITVIYSSITRLASSSNITVLSRGVVIWKTLKFMLASLLPLTQKEECFQELLASLYGNLEEWLTGKI